MKQLSKGAVDYDQKSTQAWSHPNTQLLTRDRKKGEWVNNSLLGWLGRFALLLWFLITGQLEKYVSLHITTANLMQWGIRRIIYKSDWITNPWVQLCLWQPLFTEHPCFRKTMRVSEKPQDKLCILLHSCCQCAEERWKRMPIREEMNRMFYQHKELLFCFLLSWPLHPLLLLLHSHFHFT